MTHDFVLFLLAPLQGSQSRLTTHHVYLHLTPFLVTQEKMEACTRTLVAGAPTRFLRLQCSRSLVIVYTVTLDWLAAEQFCQNSERSYRLYSVQYSTVYSVQVYSAVYYWCTVDTWSLHAVQACAVHTTASYVNIDRAYYVCSTRRIGRKDQDQSFNFVIDTVMISQLSGECLHLLHYFQNTIEWVF